jgi:hypothetical protein
VNTVCIDILHLAGVTTAATTKVIQLNLFNLLQCLLAAVVY